MPLAVTAPLPLTPPAFMMLPFAAMLLAIAFMPFLFAHHWERFYHRWAVFFASISVGYYLFVNRDLGRVLHTAHDYLGFMALTGSLFVVAGGIQIVVTGEAKPWVNLLFLFAGSILSNLIGTTGASMLLIRPWIRMNKYRITGFHIVFFIFLISNISGCLTPIGDPPLFLGYLQGVPFWWVLAHCWKAWLVGVGLLGAVFFVFDWLNYRKAPKAVRERETARETWRFRGLSNVFFMAVILGAVFVNNPPLLREALMTGVAIASYFITRKEIHEANDFHMGPIVEVGWLFLGLFATMMPAVDYLQAHANAIGLRSDMQFYWESGAFSGVLDSAPAYLAFIAAAFGLHGLPLDTGMSAFIAQHSRSLIAISLGTVFFGALTYLGNGPNFMVKAIAERAKVETPGFIAYLVRYSLPILLPLLFFVGILFFSGRGIH